MVLRFLGLNPQECHDILSDDFAKLLEEEDQSLKNKILGKKKATN